MIVAGGAAEPQAKEDFRGRLAACGGITVGPIVVGRRIRICAAAGGDQLPRELVDRLIVRDAFADPFMESRDALSIERSLFAP